MRSFLCAVLVFAVTLVGLGPKALAEDPQPEKAKRGPVEVPPPSDKALQYYHSGNILWLVNTVWSLLVPGVILCTGFSARMRDWAGRIGRKWFFTVGIYAIFFVLLCYVVNLPLAYYEEFVRPHDYGLSNQTFGKWLSDSLTTLLLSLAAGFLFLWIPYGLLRISPRRWWLYTSLLAVPFLFLVMLIAPIWIAPLFNHFGDMKNKELEAKILGLADRAGIDGSRVYEVDKSVDTKAVNAYVTGFWTTKRIVLWDTLLQKLDDREVLFIVGHEMGHYVLQHVLHGIVLGSILIFVVLYLIHRTGGGLIGRYKERFGFDRLADVASLPLLLLLGNVFVLVVSPVGLAYSRHIEHEADRFGLEITQDNEAAAQAFVKLQEENLGNPRPGWFYKTWRATHPPLGERIDFCNEYRPWEKGEPLRYGELFRQRREK